MIEAYAEHSAGAADVAPLSRHQIESRLQQCAPLPSLTRNTNELLELLNAPQPYSTQICDIIRRDPSLTARILRMVNSVYYGLATPVKSIEEAVFFIGMEQIRQLTMFTPVIEDFQRLAGKTRFPWRQFWQHCVGTAIMTREVIASMFAPPQEIEYVAGLVHDVGKIAMSAAFPQHFSEIQRRLAEGPADLLALETELLGLNHAELGALYLRRLNLPDVLVETAQFHHQPHLATREPSTVAAVQIADLLVRHAHIGVSGNPAEVAPDDWLNAGGWNILFPHQGPDARALAHASLQRSLEQIPKTLAGLI